MPNIKITDEQFKAELEAGLQLYEIAEKYEMSIFTLYQKKYKITEKEDEEKFYKKQKRKPYLIVDPPNPLKELPKLKKFDLKVGDYITDTEPDINKKIHKYQVVKIYRNHYLCKKISGSGSWLVSFLKADYQIGYTLKKRFSQGSKEEV